MDSTGVNRRANSGVWRRARPYLRSPPDMLLLSCLRRRLGYRLVYQVLEEEHIVEVLRMWTPGRETTRRRGSRG